MPSNKKNIHKFTFFFKKLLQKRNNPTIDNKHLFDSDSFETYVGTSDEVDGRFKKLYPETAVNTASGAQYRIVPTIFGNENRAGVGAIDVNRVALEVGEPEKREKKGKALIYLRHSKKLLDRKTLRTS